MIKLLTGKSQKRVAWFLLFVFYGEFLASSYAARSNQYRYREINSSNRLWHPVAMPTTPAKSLYTPAPLAIAEPVAAAARAEEVQLRKEAAIRLALPEELKEIKKEEKEEKADIGGPGQPEMNTFKSVGADNMVNLFTGDFSYNIPLLDVGGYPVNIFYSAGASMDQEASWVGLGWNINPGTVNRTMRGLPDDYNGDDVITKTQSMKPDITVGVSGSTGSFELLGVPKLPTASIGLSINAGIFYNNRRGLGLEAGVGFDYSPLKNISVLTKDEKNHKDTSVPKLTVSAGINLNSQNGMSLNAGFSVYKYDKENQVNRGLSTSIDYNSRQGMTDLSISGEAKQYQLDCSNDQFAVSSTQSPIVPISFARSSFTPSIRMPITRVNQFYSVKLGKEKKVLFKNGTISGYVNESRIDKSDQVQVKPAFGYMYYEKANDNKDALLDFNRLQDGVYTYKTPVISIPAYTYDVFSISGEGTGGSFRGYRGNMGYVRDNFSKTRTSGRTVSLDLGKGNLFHGGTILGYVVSPSEVGEWKEGNALTEMTKFKKTDGDFQTFYFRNPGEQAIIDEDYYNKLGGDQLIRPYLENRNTATPLLPSTYQVFDKDQNLERAVTVNTDSYRKVRDKRTQVITYLSAEDADLVGLDKYIYSYTENVFQPGSCSNPAVRTAIRRWNPGYNGLFYRKANHLSEIDVLEGDGRRYVYGIPVYQVKQKEVTFSTENVPATDNQLIGYSPGNENSTSNTKGRDGFFQSEEMNGYAHSFLLTGILSPDYMDVTGDGITDDDKGTAIRFNYSRVNKNKVANLNTNFWYTYKWRMPVAANTANYNEGLKADSKDDKGLYTYGEKELWYMHSIESKNVVATFHVSERNDGKSVAGENGGLAAGPGQKKLDKINLYTKADFLKYGANARPIKTVHFEYSYSACPDYPLNDGAAVMRNGVNVNAAKGKLTLVSIWFSYNGNNNQVKNKYLFKYAATNPAYNSAENDRWGSYKPHLENPDDAGNNDYPYTLQDAEKSNQYAAAWNLEKILLPGGAVMNVKYEADDYGYVQDKRASQMTKVAGFGLDANVTAPSDKLYTWSPANMFIPGKMDHRFVYFDVATPLSSKNEIAERYLQGFKQLLLKLWVKMPKGNIGQEPAFEPVVIYGAIKDYGFAKNAGGSINYSRFYVELAETAKHGSPIMETVIQFLKDHLPSRAYPGYEVKDGGALVQLVRAVFGMMNNFLTGVMGFEKNLKITGKCREAKLTMSFGRLNNPDLKKTGGGHRVKEIRINDNWNKMTGQFDSWYGQQYDYTTKQIINGQTVQVSSGVATYEPGIGNEENPFREILSYSESQFLGPTDHNNIELPLAETFFPSPMIGYGKVTVRSIHNKDNKNIKSGIGLQETVFYTAKDFPVFSEFTSFDGDSRHQHKPSVLQKTFNYDKKDYLTLTQGVRVVLNDMNGKLKSQTSYAENDLSTPINYTGYIYRLKQTGENKYELDNKVPVISGPDGKISQKLIGRDIEVMNDFREHFSYTQGGNLPLNVDLFKLGNIPILIPTFFKMAFKDKSMYRSATTLKVVNQYGIIDSVVNIDKGSVVGTKNLVFDAETGGVLITRTNNEFNKPVYQFNYPAWWVHTGMEPAYRNIDVTYENVFFRNGRIEQSAQVNMSLFESGDELLVKDLATKGPMQSDACIGLGDPLYLPQSNEYRVWALDIRKDTRNTDKEFIFIDRYGNPYNAANATIRIIRSGKRNITGASAGSLVCLKNPVRTVSGIERVVIDNNTDVINAGAAEFKEKWRVNDMFYAKDSVMTVVRKAPILSDTAGVSSSASFGLYREKPFLSWNAYSQLFQNPTHFIAAQYDTKKGSTDYKHRSWLLFNFDNISGLNSGSTILSGRIFLPSHRANHTIIIGGHQPTGTTHNSSAAHYQGFYKDNNFVLSRMLSAWPGFSNQSVWAQKFNSTPPGGSSNQLPVLGTTYPPEGSSMDYRVDITSLVKGMVKDKFDPAKNYATALMINLATEDYKGLPVRRVCFDNSQGNSPTIALKYYNCNVNDSIVYQGNANGAPVVPPPGYMYCKTEEVFKLCLSVFSKKQMNPYIEGVLGNWRGWRSYVYYGERREGDPAIPTDIRKDGLIKDFEPYWAFDNSNIQLGKTNSAKWVWNAEITQYNRKGAELEDHDPLDRYNAGIYGYQESLPIAVVNNSRLRLSAFDGFEDYFYKDDPCEPYCKPSKRHFTTGITSSQLDTLQSHTGRYSVRVNAGTTYNMAVKVSEDDTVSTPDIRIKLDKTPYQQVVVTNPRGIGLKGYYYNSSNWQGAPVNTREDASVNLRFEAKNNNGCKSGGSPMPPYVNCGNMSVQWKGKIQVITAGEYEFMCVNADDEAYVHINGSLKATDTWAGVHTRTPVYLSAGTLHTIQVDFRQFQGVGSIHLLWRKPGTTNFVPIPSIHLYPEGKEYLADGTTQTQTIYCVKPDIIQSINHHLIDSFNLIAGRKMVISTWVRKGSNDCKCTGYPGLQLKVKDASGAVVAILAPKEKIIEGWQQYEAVFDVPAGATIKLEFAAPSDAALYFDDLRLHPFNANMKSFVYDPVTLRLAAELDENNFASFYEYDDDGTLVRVKKETKLGIKTITETRSATQKKILDLE